MKNWQDITILVVLLITFALGIIGILNLRKGMTAAPNLTINMEDTTVTDQKEISVTGKTDSGATVKINGQNVETNNSGNFSATISLKGGDNTVNIVATKNGKETTAQKKVVLQSKEKSVAGAETGGKQQGENLSTSGPAENLMGTVGLTSILLCGWYYFKSRKKTNSKYSKFTL